MIDSTLWERLTEKDPKEVCERSGCRWLAERGGYVAPMLGGEYLVRPKERAIETLRPALGGEKPPGFTEAIVLVNYLLSAQDEPPAGVLVPPDRLPEGMFYFRGIHGLPTEKLAEAFGKDAKGLLGAAKRFGVEVAAYGDASFVWRALPRVPVTFVLWAGDEEFPARASVLFDARAHRQLALDALGTVASLGIKRLLKAAEAPAPGA